MVAIRGWVKAEFTPVIVGRSRLPRPVSVVSVASADQNGRDYAAFSAAIADGRLAAGQ